MNYDEGDLAGDCPVCQGQNPDCPWCSDKDIMEADMPEGQPG